MSRLALRGVRPEPGAAIALGGVVAVTAYVTSLLWAADRLTYDGWFPLLALPVLAVAGTLVLHRWTAYLHDRWLFQVAVLALVLKLMCGVLRYLMAYVLYDGSDAGYYYTFGVEAYQEYRYLDFSRELPHGGIPGTGFVAAVTAMLYTVTGPTMTGGFVVFAFIGFWGQWLAFLAFRRAVPDGHHRRYALLVFFLPTLVFWPSALGKDAWMQMAIGLALFGASFFAVRQHRVRGLVLLAGGLLLAGLVRPHVAAFVALGVIGGLALLRPARRTSMTPVLTVVGTVVLGAAAVWAATRGATFVGAESLSLSDLESAADRAGGRGASGGSEFTPVPLLSPLGPAAALLTVLYRPLPFDAHNVQALLAAAEGTFLLWLTWCWRWSLLTALRRSRTAMYTTACLIAVVLFVAAFSEFANFGILARQRAQFMPMFLALLCLPSMRGNSLDPRTALALARPRVPGRTT